MMETNTPLLKVDGIGIQFGGLKAVSDITLEINKGELIGLIGPNGAGKTTFFNLITGVYVPTEGQILLNEKKLNGLPPYKSHKRELAAPSKTFVYLVNCRY